MQFWVLMGLYLLFVLVVLLVMFRGKGDGNSIFDKLYRLVCVHLPNGIKAVARLFCGEAGPRALDATWEYLAWSNNPLVQMFYIAVVTLAYSAYTIYLYPFMPNPYLAGWHRHVGFVNYIVCVFSWYMSSIKDPGVVTDWNVEGLCKHYGWDSPLFDQADCRTCKFTKPARSKHCSLCDACVSRFDHHCIWINNCVGIGNHRWFLLFLLSHGVICCYGAVVGFHCLYYIIMSKGLISAQFVDVATGTKVGASYYVIFQYLLHTDSIAIFLTCLCAVMGLLTMGFFCWHMFLVLTNVTSNEMSKWKFLRYCLKEEDKEDEFDELENNFNNGWWRNLKEVTFPIDVNQLALPQASFGSVSKKKADGGEKKTNEKVAKSGGGKKKNKNKPKVS